MYQRPVEVLLVEPDAELAAMMLECLEAAGPINGTHASDAASALREELTATHDVLVISGDLPDGRWQDLVKELRQANRSPVILLVEQANGPEMLEAVRARVMDVLVKPFDLVEFAALVRRAGRRAVRRQRQAGRNRRLRKLTARILHERRDLRRRIDLICRDFVHAYRRLAQRVSEADLISRD